MDGGNMPNGKKPDMLKNWSGIVPRRVDLMM
jgi:hypothetical protein